MKRVTVEDVEVDLYDEDLHSDRRVLSSALGTDDIAIVRYVLDPGERFSGALHAHMDQEEVFVVLDGAVTFETVDGEVTVAAGEAIRFAPGEFQTGRNDGDERLLALAFGAPRTSEDVRILRIPVLDDREVSCPACDHDHMRIGRGDESELVCPKCGTGMKTE